MSRFNELNENINVILKTILGSQELCKCLYYNNNPEIQPNLADTKIIMFKNLFPTPIVPQITDTEKSMITIVQDDFALGRTNNAFKTSRILFNIIVHTNLWLIPGTNKIRPYSILHELDTLFNQQRIAGIGKLEFVSGRWMGINEKWQGYQIAYKVVDFN